MDFVLESLKPNSEILRVLAREGIAAKEVEIHKPRNLKAVAFSAEQREKALAVLGLQGVELVEVETNVAATRLLSRKVPLAVKTGEWDGNRPEEFAAIAQEVLLASLEKDIVIEVPHKKTISPREDGIFHILIWSSPLRGARRENRVPGEIFGIEVDCRNEAFSPSGQGQVIMDQDYAVAEIVGDNLYIFHDVCHYGRRTELEIFRQICLRAKEEIRVANMTPAERAEWEEAQRAKQREAYAKICEGRWGVDAEGAREDIEAMGKEVIAAQKLIADRTRKINAAKRQLDKPEVDKEKDRKGFAAEFDQLCRLPQVESVRLTSDRVTVFTEPLTVVYHRSVYDLGRYRIEIGVGEYNLGDIKCYNLTRTVNGRDHPNGTREGGICFGNVSPGIGKLVGDYQILIAVSMVIQFLQYADETGWLTNLKNWPQVGGSNSDKAEA